MIFEPTRRAKEAVVKASLERPDDVLESYSAVKATSSSPACLTLCRRNLFQPLWACDFPQRGLQNLAVTRPCRIADLDEEGLAAYS